MYGSVFRGHFTSRSTAEEVNGFREWLSEKGNFNVGQARRMIYDRNEWQDTKAVGCQVYMKPLEMKVCVWLSLQRKGIKMKFFFYFF